MLNSKRISFLYLVAFVTLCVQAQSNDHLNQEDSIQVLNRIYMYDFDQQKFNDIDEPFLEEYWYSNRDEAKKLFSKAILLNTAPIYERMILASYLYHDHDFEKVKYILDTCKSKTDTIEVFRVMDSYNIKFSDFNISAKTLNSYCNSCNYQ